MFGDSWTVTEPGQRSRPALSAPAKATRPGRSASLSSLPAERPRATATSSADDGLRPASGPGRRGQDRRLSDLAVPRRQRLVCETLQVVRDGDFDPARGLAAAAAAAAAAEEQLWRTTMVQQANCASLAIARATLAAMPEPGPASAPCPRTRDEQQARCELLARPREPRPETHLQSPGASAPVQARSTSAAAQQRRCDALSQPRTALAEVPQSEEPPAMVGPWRARLLARAGADVPEEVAAARAMLAQMRDRVEATARARSAASRPSSAKRSGVARVGGAAQEAAAAEDVQALRELVEEVLWVSLLQVRSCYGLSGARGGSRITADGGYAPGLEDRLGAILVSTVGAALRPVARRILGPGAGLVRRIRAEFPRLSAHVGFRESDDAEYPAVLWAADEVASRTAEVRACRDKLLAMDLTKTAVSRLGG